MPGISRFGVKKLKEHLETAVQNGLKSLLIFGVIEQIPKVSVNCHIRNCVNKVLFRMKKLQMQIVKKIQLSRLYQNLGNGFQN